jgi:hypothetical protein
MVYIVIVVVLCILLCIAGFIVWLRQNGDFSVNDRNIKSPAPDPEYPYIGIWKTNPKNRFGVIIEKADNGMYSVSFFARGRFKPGKWKPNTPIIGDPDYAIINKNTIYIKMNKFHRMPRRL